MLRFPRPPAAVMPVTSRSCSVPGQEGWPKCSAQFDPGHLTETDGVWKLRGLTILSAKQSAVQLTAPKSATPYAEIERIIGVFTSGAIMRAEDDR